MNLTIFWGGREYIPFLLFCELKGLCRGRGLALLESVPESDYGECNYTTIPEGDLHLLVDKSYKHLFNKESEVELLCVDKTLVIALQIREGLKMFDTSKLRIVK